MDLAIMLRRHLRLRLWPMPHRLLQGQGMVGYRVITIRLDPVTTGARDTGPRVRMPGPIGLVQDITDIATIRATGVDKTLPAEAGPVPSEPALLF